MGILLLLLTICLVNFTLFIDFSKENLSLKLKILFIKVDLLNFIEKQKNKPKKEKKQKNKKIENIDIKTSDEKVTEKDVKREKKPKFKFEIQKMDEYFGVLEDIIDVLDKLAFCFVFKNIECNIKIGFEDVSKTGQCVGTFWAVYGMFAGFLQRKFKVCKLKTELLPNWESKEFDINGNITIKTNIFRVLTHIKYKKILKIRKRILS